MDLPNFCQKMILGSAFDSVLDSVLDSALDPILNSFASEDTVRCIQTKKDYFSSFEDLLK